jgi:hypothetical protein
MNRVLIYLTVGKAGGPPHLGLIRQKHVKNEVKRTTLDVWVQNSTPPHLLTSWPAKLFFTILFIITYKNKYHVQSTSITTSKIKRTDNIFN